MRSYNAPACVVEYMRNRDLVDSDYYMYESGRALGWIRMAADAIEELPNELEVAKYHAYAGISAARTAIDALASWLNARLNLRRRGASVDLKKEHFQETVVEAKPSIRGNTDRLARLLQQIDEPRQRVQHREGVALLHYVPGGWHLTRGLQAPRDQDASLPSLLREWANLIETEVCQIVGSFES